MPDRAVLWRIVALALGVRIVLQAIGMVALTVQEIGLEHALDMWSKWDAPHYLRIAEVGYRERSAPGDDPLFIVFFPLFPLAVRAVSFVVRDLVASGLVVSFVASVGAGWFLYRLVRIDDDHDEAWRAVLLFFAFPTAYFLSAPYTESLYIFAVLACLYAARRGMWARAGLAGAVATGTRVTGVALAPTLVAEALTQTREIGGLVRRVGWIALAGAGLAAYLAVNWIVHNDPFWFLEVQRFHWYQQPVPPWQPVIDAVRGLGGGAGPSTVTFIYGGRLLGVVVGVGLLLAGIGRLRFADGVYGWSSLVLMLSTAWLISLPRYLLVVYPIFIVGAKLTRARWLLWTVIAVGAVLQSWLFSRYAVGSWTF